MSASTDLQHAITLLLAQASTVTLGDGAATVFPVAHGLGMEYLPAVAIRAAERLLELGTDYTLARVDADTLQVTALAGAPGASAWSARVGRLRAAVPVVEFVPKDLATKIEVALKKHGLCIHVMPPVEQKVKPGFRILRFNAVEVRIRIIEQPALNFSGVSCYDLKDDLYGGLHWQTIAGLKFPLYLAERPMEEVADQQTRILDVLFTAAYDALPPAAA